MEIAEVIKIVLFSILAYLVLQFYNNSRSHYCYDCANCFRAAVFEHIPLGDMTIHTPREIVDLNLKVFAKAIQIASKEKANIVVFPEDSLINSENYNRTVLINELFEEMPISSGETKVNFCLDSTNSNSILRKISCLARQHSIFVAINFGDKVACKSYEKCPPDNYFLYNTIALFDWDGNLVAKYHKMQLYYEFHYNIPKTCPTDSDDCPYDPVVHYDSPFGRLGFMLCFDLMYKLPGISLIKNRMVNTIIYSTYWFNYLPFVSSIQMQQSFALAHNVNFLSAGVQIPSTGTIGGGIYSGRRGALVYSNEPDGLSKLLIANLPTSGHSYSSSINCPPDSKIIPVLKQDTENLINTHMNVSGLKLVLASKQDVSLLSSCCPYSGICCKAYYKMAIEDYTENTEDEYLYLLFGNITSGALGQSRYPIRQEFCGLVVCKDPECQTFADSSNVSFTSLHLSATFKSKYVYPSVLTNNFQLLPTRDWNYVRVEPNENIVTIRNPVQQVIAVTLYGRQYDSDPKYEH